MHELESFLHLLQRLSYFDQTFLYADEVRDFHGAHHLQSPLVRVESLKSITEDAHSQAIKTQTRFVDRKKKKKGKWTDGRTASDWSSEGVRREKKGEYRRPALTLMPELAAISTNSDTMKNPLQLSPPGKENIKSMFLYLKVML